VLESLPEVTSVIRRGDVVVVTGKQQRAERRHLGLATARFFRWE
jgi:hypothetical protein